MICEIKTELLIAYQRAAESYSKAIANLAHNTVLPAEYEKARLAAEKARKIAVDARNDLQAHTLEHGC